MIDPKLVLALLAVYGCVWIGGQAVKGVKKIGHGAKVVACAIHMPSVKCEKPETK